MPCMAVVLARGGELGAFPAGHDIKNLKFNWYQTRSTVVALLYRSRVCCLLSLICYTCSDWTLNDDVDVRME